jgi:hypothetical protein
LCRLPSIPLNFLLAAILSPDSKNFDFSYITDNVQSRAR